MNQYWTWTCSKCAFDDNRNTDKKCVACGKRISCRESGGHYIPAETQRCDGVQDDGETPCNRAMEAK